MGRRNDAHAQEPRAAAHGHKWYEFDVTWITIWALKQVGLARDVVLDNVTVYMAYPTQVTVTLATLPAGLTVSVDGTNYITPASVICATNSSHTLSAPTAQLSADGHIRYPFVSWSDNGLQTHAIMTSLFDAAERRRPRRREAHDREFSLLCSRP